MFCWIQLKTPMKSKAMSNAKNIKKNNSTRNVNRMNCHTRSMTMTNTRNTAHKGIERERNSIPPEQRITLTHLNIWKNEIAIPLETIKKSYPMRTSDHNDDTLSHTKCCNMLRNGRAEWSTHFLFPKHTKTLIPCQYCVYCPWLCETKFCRTPGVPE